MENKFLHARGRQIVDRDGREVLLCGWGLGNWLLPEGYMWLSDSRRFDRPRRIERVIEELAGEEFARDFWKSYRENYIRREDIRRMAELGYNSLRIPFSYRLFLSDAPGIHWKEEGFALLERCVDWCREAGLYVFFDLHGAPGGQTGTNIDDSPDDVPRLFLDSANQDKCVALWERLAETYRDRETVGGYDLLNEPIAPPGACDGDYDYLIPSLAAFYDRLICAIRRIDKNHMISLEGAHWATDIRIFDRRFDDNMVLHFHCYGEKPDAACLRKYLDVCRRLDVPAWMGETGENKNEWYAALYPLAHSLGIGYNLWPWKKMDCANSPCSIRRPDDYGLLTDYAAGGPHPGRKTAQTILKQYLENCKLENCVQNDAVTRHVFRRPPFSLCAVDFDELPGAGVSFSGTALENPSADYRRGCRMHLTCQEPEREKSFCFDSGWDRFGLLLTKGEFACYRMRTDKETHVTLRLAPGYPGAVMQVGWNDGGKTTVSVPPSGTKVYVCLPAGSGSIRIGVTEGKACLLRIGVA